MSWHHFLYPRRRQVFRLDPRAKIGLLLSLSVLVVCLDRPFSLIAIFTTTMVLSVIARPPKAFWLYLLPAVLIGMWGMVVSQALFYAEYPRTPIATVIHPGSQLLGSLTGGVALYWEGLSHGLVQSLRFAIMLTLGLLVGFSTEPRDILSGLLSCRVPPAAAFMVTASLRFVPTVVAEARMVVRTQHLRGARILSISPLRTVRGLLGFLKPLLVRNVRRAGLVADAVETRGFSPDLDVSRWRESSLRPLRFRLHDWLLVSITATLTLGAVTAKLAHVLYQQGFANAEWLRVLSGFSARFL